jgi:hypothetical protein
MGSAGLLMDEPTGQGFACEGPLGAWWNEGQKIESEPPLFAEGQPLLGAVLGLADEHPAAGFADAVTLEMTADGLVVTPTDAGTPMEVILIPRDRTRCAEGRIEIDQSRWHAEAFAGTAIRESGTFTLMPGSRGSLVLRYQSSRKGLLLYGIPVWVGDEDLYRFGPSAGEDALPAPPPPVSEEGAPPDDLAALAIYGAPRARVLAVDGAPPVQSIWQLSRANVMMLVPGAHELEVEVSGQVAFWSLMPPPTRVLRLRGDFAGGRTYVVFGQLMARGEPWAELFDAGPDVPSRCLPELAIPPTTEACLAARGIESPRPPAEEARP